MRQRFLNVIPECYIDTNLIEHLLKGSVNHQHSCTKVVGLLNGKFKDQFAVGIIDKDKVQVGYIRECEVIASTNHLTLLKHKFRDQYLITISPAADGFILDCAVNECIDLKEYGLPSSLKEFTNISKSVTSNVDERFKALFRAMKDNEELVVLRDVLRYLVENGFRVNPDVLKNLFLRSD